MAGRYLGIALTRQGRVAEGCAALESALAAADASGDRAARRVLIGTLCNSLCLGPAPVGQVIHRLEELLGSTAGDGVLEAVISRFLSLLLAMAGRLDEARERIRTSSPVLDALDQSTQWTYRWAAAEALELTGDRAGAERELVSRWRRFRDFGDEAVDERAMNTAARLAVLYCNAGRWDEAAEFLSYGADAPAAGYAGTVVRRLVAEARLAAHHGRTAEGVTSAQRAVEDAEPTDLLTLRALAWLALAEAQRTDGGTAEADASDAKALELYDRKGNVAAAERLRAHAAARA